MVGEKYRFTERPGVNATDGAFFKDVGAGKTYKVSPDGRPVVFLEGSQRRDGQAFGPDGRLYTNSSAVSQVLAWNTNGKSMIIADGFKGRGVSSYQPPTRPAPRL